MKTIGIILLMLGLLMLIFAIAAYSELSAATKSVSPTGPMALTKLICPQLFTTSQTGVTNADPVALVGLAFNRIYMIGGGSILVTIVGILLLMGKPASVSTVRPL